MICGNCKKEIGYDKPTVAFHLDAKCTDPNIPIQDWPARRQGNSPIWAKSARLQIKQPDGSWKDIPGITINGSIKEAG